MVKLRTLGLAAAILLLPGVAAAQNAESAPRAAASQTAAPAATPATGTTAATVQPQVDPESVRSEIATTPPPVLDPAKSLAPENAPTNDGLGSISPVQAALTDEEAKTPPTPEIGQPTGDWRLQPHVTDIGAYGHWFNNQLLLPLMAAVTLIVFALLAYAMWRYRAKVNPVASKTSHHTLIEVIWTAVPVLILVVIAVPSFRLLADQYDPPKPDLTIKAIGHQWYWEYQYPDHGDLGFDAVMLTEQETAAKGLPRLLETDNRVVVPAGAVVKVLVTAADVGHSWAVPAFWVKMDAWPGRINETWFKVDRPGVYYGQCSELCGTRHAFMPITVEVMEPARFNAWIDAKQKADGAELAGPRFATGANGKLVVLDKGRVIPAAAAQSANDPALGNRAGENNAGVSANVPAANDNSAASAADQAGATPTAK